MLKVENLEAMNFMNAIRGARNPMNSWAKLDSYINENGEFVLGENDKNLLVRLCRSGSDHRKFMRQIFVTMDITAPLYWWKEFDTYKVATVANSTSTMHKIHSQVFDLEHFSCDKLNEKSFEKFKNYIEYLEELRQSFVDTKDKTVWYELIQMLPTNYNQMRTCTMNYETLINIYNARKNHKLDEWHVLCDAIKILPYAKELILMEE